MYKIESEDNYKIAETEYKQLWPKNPLYLACLTDIAFTRDSICLPPRLWIVIHTFIISNRPFVPSRLKTADKYSKRRPFSLARVRSHSTRAGLIPTLGNRESILFFTFWSWSRKMELIIYNKESILIRLPISFVSHNFWNRPSTTLGIGYVITLRERGETSKTT